MTTTLRPAGPEEHGADGKRSRGFTVCVNGRPVGLLRLATDERLGPAVGTIASLGIGEGDQRRGRGAVAALAAEEVLRGWGCRRVQAVVPEDAPHALRLAAALGYTERNRSMVKQLPGSAAQLPPGTGVRPMAEADYEPWYERTHADYVQEWVESGVSPERAVAIADTAYVRGLPDGYRTTHTALRVLTHEGADVGWLWVWMPPAAGTAGYPWIYLVEVDEAYRGQGHGRSLMLVAENECLAAGARELGLNVLAANTPAMRLYASLGYRTTTRTMTKSLL